MKSIFNADCLQKIKNFRVQSRAKIITWKKAEKRNLAKLDNFKMEVRRIVMDDIEYIKDLKNNTNSWDDDTLDIDIDSE